MKPKAIFDLAIRLLGLYFLYQGLSGIPNLLSAILVGMVLGSLTMILSILWPLALAWWLIGGAPQLSRLAYPNSEED
jgi:hypothetical protein